MSNVESKIFSNYYMGLYFQNVFLKEAGREESEECKKAKEREIVVGYC